MVLTLKFALGVNGFFLTNHRENWENCTFLGVLNKSKVESSFVNAIKSIYVRVANFHTVV